MMTNDQNNEAQDDVADSKKIEIPEPTDADFQAIKNWGMEESPFLALEDYSELNMELRWLNKEQRKAHLRRYLFREIHRHRGLQDYYKNMDRPISKNKWEFLKLRKSWFIVPLEWDRFAKPDCKGVLDVGCGDGDALQRVADFIARAWEKAGYEGHEIHIFGCDLNERRVKNAQQHFVSPHPLIKGEFHQHDAVTDQLPFDKNHFSYCISTGVFGVMEDDQASLMMKEICRVTESGLYLEVLGEETPGAHFRNSDDFSQLLAPFNFNVEQAHWVLSEPFTLEGSKDPLFSMPILRSLVLFASFNEKSP